MSAERGRGRARSAEDAGAKAGHAVDNAARKVHKEGKQTFDKISDVLNDAGKSAKDKARDVRDAIEDSVPSPVQIGLGLAVGGLGGYMDAYYIEPFGVTFAAGLLGLQLLDHQGAISLPWNANSRIAHRRSASGQMTDFAKNNLYLAGSFAAAYILLQALSGDYE